MRTFSYVLAALLIASASNAQDAARATVHSIGMSNMQNMNMPDMPTDDPQTVIPAVMKTMFETAEKPLIVEPVVTRGGWALADWLQDGRGGRALLRKEHQGWRIHLCSGNDILNPAALEKIGMSSDDAATLAADLMTAERNLDPKVLAAFASFEGTVVMASETEVDKHGGHEGHSQ